MPHLRITAGTSPSTMEPITHLVNGGTPHNLLSPLFSGSIVAHIQGLTNDDDKTKDSEYFSRPERKGVTWSIQVQGNFLVPLSADDVLFGNTFDRPLKLPWGTSAVLKFMNYIDPTLEHDLTSPTKPWALSPLISTMPYFAHSRSSPQFPGAVSLVDKTDELYLAVTMPEVEGGDSSSSETGDLSDSPCSSGSGSPVPSAGSSSTSLHSYGSKGSKRSLKEALKKASLSSKGKETTKGGKLRNTRVAEREKVQSEVKGLQNSSQRRSYFASKEKRQRIEFGPQDTITTDFCYGFINFSPSLSLQLPGGLSFDLMRYWDGQPVRFVCCLRKGVLVPVAGEEDEDTPWGRVVWCVAIEMVEDGES